MSRRARARIARWRDGRRCGAGTRLAVAVASTAARSLAVSVAVGAALSVAAATPLAAQDWQAGSVEVTPLVGLAGVWIGDVVNNSGQVAGWDYNPATGRTEAVRWDPVSGSEYLGVLGGWETASYGRAINNAGQVAGNSYTQSTSTNQGFFFDGSTLTGVGHLPSGTSDPSSFAYGLNEAGQVVGSSVVDGVSRGYFWDAAGIRETGGLAPGAVSNAFDVNDGGVVAGIAQDPGVGTRAVAADGDPGTPLDVLGSLNPAGSPDLTYVFSVNEAGQMAGRSHDGTVDRAFRTTAGGALEVLGGPGVEGWAWSLDEAGRAVGKTGPRAALWRVDGSQVFLDALAGGGWSFTQAQGISDDGRWILARGSGTLDGGSAFDGYVLLENTAGAATVTPEPGTWLLLATGLAGLGVVARRRRRVGEG